MTATPSHALAGQAFNAGPASERPTGKDAPLLQVEGLTKKFGSVEALKSVDLNVGAGEIHGLIGANGAGKSTLVRILAGAVLPDAGSIRLDGEEVTIRHPQDATERGLAFLHQELSLVSKFTAVENMALGVVTRGRLGFANRRPAYQRAERVAQDIGFDFSLDTPVNELTVAQRGLVALGRSLMRRVQTRLIAFDEPTAALSAREADRLFEIIRSLSQSGVGVLYVSHRLEEIVALCHRVTVFRDGRVEADFPRGELSKDALVSALTGGVAEAISVPASSSASSGRVALEARGVTRLPAVNDVSLKLRAGEVVGVAGLVGAGRTELARLLCGVDKRAAGEILVDGRPVPLSSPAEAVSLGLGLVPEERRSQGLFLDKDATFNLNIGSPRALRIGRWFTMPRRARSRAEEVAKRVDLRPLKVDTPVRLLSGGNQQKLVLGRWLLGKRQVLILDEPTRGIDIGARAQIHRMLRELAREGLALLVISSDFEELLNCDRVLVMARGRIVEELTGAAISEERMLHAAYEQKPPEVVLGETAT